MPGLKDGTFDSLNMPEHQGASNVTSESGPAEYTPSKREAKDLKIVNKLFHKSKEHRKKYDEKWLDYYKFWRGRQWKETRPSFRHSEVINFVFQAIQSVVPIMTDSRPKFDFLPQEPSDFELSKLLSELAQADWEKGNWLYQLVEMVYDSHIYGTGIGYMGFDAEENKIVFESADPFYFFPDPSATDVNTKARYAIYAEPLDLQVVKKEYPDKAKFLRSDVDQMDRQDKTDLDQVRFKSPTDNKTILEGSSTKGDVGRAEILKITCYMYSDEFDEKEVPNEKDPSKKEFEQTLRFPKGRKIVIAGGIHLEEGEIEFDDRKFPWARLVNYVDPRVFWGISEIEQLESPQRIFNKLISFSLDVLTLMGNPIWKVGAGANIDVENLINQPGLIVEATDISQVQREEGVQLQPYVLQLIDRLQGWFDGISGSNDVSRGINPTGVTAASAISELQDATQTRTRLKSRNLDACLQNLGQLYASRVFQFYTVPRIVRLTDDQNAQKFFRFKVDEDEKGNKTVTQTGFKRNGREDAEAKVFKVKGDFDVRVTTGSALPFAKKERGDLAFKLFETGVIDEQELLKAVEYPNWEAVLQRVQEKQKEAQAAEQGAVEAEAQAKEGAKADNALPPQ